MHLRVCVGAYTCVSVCMHVCMFSLSTFQSSLIATVIYSRLSIADRPRKNVGIRIEVAY